ncbi:YxiG family protein [Niallia sp. FSL W8-0635]|uniref:YxiG family protein n=1 Tax=Niallia sp. FSL W8-0635 TaxID=2975337 RepID=UPI0030FCE007
MSINLDTEKKLQQFFSEIEYQTIINLNIDYLKEAISLKLISVNNDELIKINITFKQVMSYYIYQEPEYDTYRLNNFDEESNLLLTESSYFPQGFGKIMIESLNSELKEIETLSSTTNFYFQVNNKDYFFIEANSLSINGIEYRNLITDDKELKKPLD